MKYIKKSVQLANSYPVILLALIPSLILNILSKLLGTAVPTTSYSVVAAFIIPLIAVVVGILIRIYVTRIAFTVRNNDEQYYDIDMKKAFKRGIPRLLLNSFTAGIILYAISFGLLITIMMDVVIAVLAFESGNLLTIISTVLFSIDGIGKTLILLLSSTFITIYISVFLIFLNTRLTINDMMKASFKYTFNNFKKLFIICLLLVIIPMTLLFGSVYIYNAVNGLSFTTMLFMQSWEFVTLQFIVALCTILYYVSVVLTWNDEEDKEFYLNADKSSSKPEKKKNKT